MTSADSSPATRPHPRSTLGPALRDRRRRKGMLIREVAEAVGVTRATVADWESGRLQIAPQRYQRLAEVLELDPATFVEAKGEGALLSCYRSLSRDGQAAVAAYAVAQMRAEGLPC